MLPSRFLTIGIFIYFAPCTLGAEPATTGSRPISADDLWKIKRLGAPSISPDGEWAVVEVTTFDVGKDESASNLWLLSTDGKQQKQLTNAAGKNTGPKWSSDGRWIAFTSKRGNDESAQVYIIPAEGGEARRVSNLPSAASSLKWSGDNATIFCIGWTWLDAATDDEYRAKEKAAKERKSKAMIIDDAVYRYWDHWIADGKRPVVFSVDVETGKHRNLLAGTKQSLSPFEPSEHDFDVSPDGKELCFVADSVKEIGRDTNLDLYTLAINNKDALPINITTENPANDFNPVYSPDGKTIAFLRTHIRFFYADTRRLVLHDREKGKNVLRTETFDLSCSNPVWLPDGTRIGFETEDHGLHNIYFIFKDEGEPFTYPAGVSEKALCLSKNKKVAVFMRSSFNMPPTVFAHRVGEKEPNQISFFNDEVVSRWKLGKYESVKIKGAGDENVQMWIVYPPEFDSKKKWPLVQVVHGGPHNGIMDDFSFRWNPQLWAAQGYVLGIVNFHGSSGFGHKFCDSITGDYGTKPMIDIMKATDWFEEKPWIDAERTAAAGGSYGGYMMMWLNGHTERFKAMVCHAGVYSYHSQMASDVVRGRERALGAFPWVDLEKVDKQSAQRYSKYFKTPTLVLHGERDFRVPVTHGLEYYNTLRQKGVSSRLVYFPDENHWILKPQNALLWHREVFAWLDKYIGKGPTAAKQ